MLKCDSSNMKDVYYQSWESEPSLFSSLEEAISKRMDEAQGKIYCSR